MIEETGGGTGEDGIGAWLDRVHDEYDEFAYRHVYAAYLAVRPPPGAGRRPGGRRQARLMRTASAMT
ncbi:hypothetical protein ACFOWE_19990 [Planomonospora corallina]|uniref:Uncharacterized protein n=1 Tax=Planomonospora corallina TaxID=1806052 RepID=A0ABV8I9M4_9ACTN